ncbi:MAG: sugar phosphate isomerase/epimerase [Akkermansiaceae bacterium]|nr:sugar phosphate isomerase/epimerase [Verrucomicrobiales bacterium]
MITRIIPTMIALAWMLPTHAADITPHQPIGYCTVDPKAAKAAGFEFAEVRIREFVKLSDADFAKYLADYRAADLPALTGFWFLPNEQKVVGPNVSTNEVEAYLEKAFDRCQQMGVKFIAWGSGGARQMPEGFSPDEAFQQLVGFAQRMAPRAEKRGIMILAEPLRKKESNTINSAAEALKWVEAVNHPNFQMLVDIYHMNEENEDASIIVKAGPHIRHVHMSNPIGRVFPLRAGEFDYRPFFKALSQINYRGPIAIEAKTENLSEEGPKAMAFIRSAYAAAAE